MADSRDILGKNRKFKGTSGVVMPKGSTAERADTESGEIRFNTTTELMEYYNGNQWKPIDAPPIISSVSSDDATGSNTVLTADGSTLYTITISGGNFGIGVNVKFIGNTGTEYTAGNINRVSGSSITCTTLSNMGTSDDPYDVQVTNPSGLAAVLEDAFSFNAPPVFVTASGTLGNVFDGQVISGTTLNAGATDAEGNTITHSIVSGSLPGTGLSISSSTGAITGTLGGTPTLGNYPLTVRAATAEGIIDRAFSIDVIANPYVVATGGTITTVDTDYKVHTFTGPGTFTVTNAGTPAGSNTVSYVVVGGGGGAGHHYGGGAGAGGYREGYVPGSYTASPLATSSLPVSVQGYPITVGSGGASAPSSPPYTPSQGNNGNNSVFSTITSAGGGLSRGYNGSVASGGPGGSGGGAGGTTSGGSGGTGNTPPVAPPQGNPGTSSPNEGGGGGGGAGSAAGPGNSKIAGAGIASSITGSPAFYAGGGNGGPNSGEPTSDGRTAYGVTGATNTGSGAGGDNTVSGGSGIVIIRYKFQ